jgi:hypothetical protein
MYIHLGQETVVKNKDIIGIFDLDTASVSPLTKGYLKEAQQNGFLNSVNEELPKSFVVLQESDGSQSVWFSQISASVLKKRCGE